jgi:hypothetical protein
MNGDLLLTELFRSHVDEFDLKPCFIQPSPLLLALMGASRDLGMRNLQNFRELGNSSDFGLISPEIICVASSRQ